MDEQTHQKLGTKHIITIVIDVVVIVVYYAKR